MHKTTGDIETKMNAVYEDIEYSGVASVKKEDEVLYESAAGYANRTSEKLNTIHTRFGIASGCKLFTAIGICQLVEQGKLSFNTRLKDCLDIEFPNFNHDVTVHHLLTHSSGIPDYFDEETMDDFEELWQERPMYQIKSLKDFLPMFQDKAMMFNPGERFHYNNAGFIVLGLIIEQQTGMPFTDYVECRIFAPAGMAQSGYFSMDQFPENTATGYIDNPDGTWRSNIYSLPIKGGSDGGAFITAEDMMMLWESLFNGELLGEEMLEILLKPHIHEDGDEYYGYGIWIRKRDDEAFKYHVMGYDPGVSFHSSVYPASGVKVVVASNKSKGAFPVLKAIEETYVR